MRNNQMEDRLVETLRMVAPGTPFRQGLDNIVAARTGALIVVGDSPEVMEIVEGGFKVNIEFTPSRLYELAKMDGAIILSEDARRILYANAQLVPEPAIPSFETGIRHRSAERFAKQTGALVVSISQRRNIITIYRGTMKYVLEDINVVVAKANQAIQTLEKYKFVLERALNHLSALEFDDLVTVLDVAVVIQRTEMVSRIAAEIDKYISELGTEGRLINMQMKELVADVEEEGLMVIRDYAAPRVDVRAREIRDKVSAWSSEELLDLDSVGRVLGYGTDVNVLELNVSPRGYRLLRRIPRLPIPVIENVIKRFSNLQDILEATIDELDEVEGIGKARAKTIKEGLRRLREQILLDRPS